MANLSIEDMAIFCKKKGFVYQNSEIYGGLAGFWDFGHLGSELKNNIKQQWWKSHVQSRDDVVGIDGSIITNPKVWEASGHVSSFEDIMLTCTKCKEKARADVVIEDQLKMQADGISIAEVNRLLDKIQCPRCKGAFEEAKQFNLMFKTNVGPKDEKSSLAYLRPETAQLMFTNFRLVQENARLKLPFGIAQMGRSFRNEISPRDFLFRCREFEQMEIEYFINPEDQDCPYINEVLDYELNIYSADMQENNKEPAKMTVKQALDSKIIKTQWHAYWLAYELKWFEGLGACPENFRIRQHLQKEKSHYALDTWDLEYRFPFGWKELEGMANRTDFDLQQHIKVSGKDLSLFDDKAKKKIIPHVVCEPSLGVERTFLVFMFDAYHDDKERGNIVLKLHPLLAPVKLGIFPLVNKLDSKAREVYDSLKDAFVCQFDRSGSVGRRYARADESGIPFCITIDFDTLKDNSVTIRDRDTTEQKRVKIEDLQTILHGLILGKAFAEI